MTGSPSVGLSVCPRCDYDLKGLPLRHCCPECGFDYSPDMVTFVARRTLQFLLLANSVFVVIVYSVRPTGMWHGWGDIYMVALFTLFGAHTLFTIFAMKPGRIIVSDVGILFIFGKNQEFEAEWNRVEWIKSLLPGGFIRMQDSEGKKRSLYSCWFLGSITRAKELGRIVRERLGLADDDSSDD